MQKIILLILQIKIKKARPTAVNLSWAIDKILNKINNDYQVHGIKEIQSNILTEIENLKKQDIDTCKSIGKAGLKVIRDIFHKKKNTVNILTHCNAGWLACIDWGTALSPIYMANREGIPVHVWVDETRPRMQGANLTMFELMEENINCTLITDNAAALVMSKNMVDMVIVGADRVAANGDTANKIGTYEKALAAKENNVPFYVALPLSTLDFNTKNGSEIPIEERSKEEIINIKGFNNKEVTTINVSVKGAKCYNPAFDITPANLITAYITEKGIFKKINELVK